MKADFSSVANDMSVHPGCSLVCTVLYLPMIHLTLTQLFSFSTLQKTLFLSSRHFYSFLETKYGYE